MSQIVGNLSAFSIKKKSDPEEQSSKNVHVMFPLRKQDTTTIIFFAWLTPKHDTKVWKCSRGIARVGLVSRKLHVTTERTLCPSKSASASSPLMQSGSERQKLVGGTICAPSRCWRGHQTPPSAKSPLHVATGASTAHVRSRSVAFAGLRQHVTAGGAGLKPP